MQRLDLTLAAPAENVALDEALLEWAEEENPEWEFLRLWESTVPMVVVGRSSRVEQEVDVAMCRRRGVPIVRRSSGGAAIVAGPGCLMFAVVLSYRLRPELHDIRRAHCHVLGRLAGALRPRLAPAADVVHAGTSDLAMKQGALSREQGETPCSLLHAPCSFRKFSGNSLRAKRTHLLYHGTLLYDFDLALVGQCLKMPPRQPEYRHARAHDEFIANVPLARSALVEAIDAAWPTGAALRAWPQRKVDQLVAERFGRDEWNLNFGATI